MFDAPTAVSLTVPLGWLLLNIYLTFVPEGNKGSLLVPQNQAPQRMYCLSAQLIPKWPALTQKKNWLLWIFKNLQNSNVSLAEIIISPRNKSDLEILWPSTRFVHNLTNIWTCICHFAMQHRKCNKVALPQDNNTIYKTCNHEKLTIWEIRQGNIYLRPCGKHRSCLFNTKGRSLWSSEIIIAFMLFTMCQALF